MLVFDEERWSRTVTAPTAAGHRRLNEASRHEVFGRIRGRVNELHMIKMYSAMEDLALFPSEPIWNRRMLFVID